MLDADFLHGTMHEPSATIGHVLVAKDGVTDVELALASEDWSELFDLAVVTQDAWAQLDAAKVLDTLQKLADEGLVGRSEEAWFKRPDLLAVTCKSALDRAPPRGRALLVEIAKLAELAKARGAAVIFTIT
jgi:hypothetical protein